MPRAKLSREAIVDAALELADDGGVERVTARELAERLGVTPMALYRHVDGIGAIIDELLERVIVRAGIVDHPASELEPWLVETFRRVHACLVAHPAVLPLLGTSAGYGREALSVVDAVLGRLASAGYGPEESVALFHGWLAYTLGAASLEAAARLRISPARAAEAAARVRTSPARAAEAAARVRTSPARAAEAAARLRTSPARAAEAAARLRTSPARAAEAAARLGKSPKTVLDTSRLEGLPNVRRTLPVLVRFTRSSTFVDNLARIVRADLARPAEVG